MSKTRIELRLVCALVILSCSAARLFAPVAGCERGDHIAPGLDFYTCPSGSFVFGVGGGGGCVAPIPADFFGPGSGPFLGPIDFAGQDPLVDTVIQRLTQGNVPEPHPANTTVDIEIVALHLVSVAPITVDFGGGGKRAVGCCC